MYHPANQKGNLFNACLESFFFHNGITMEEGMKFEKIESRKCKS